LSKTYKKMVNAQEKPNVIPAKKGIISRFASKFRGRAYKPRYTYSPSQQQRFYKTRARVLRGAKVFYPQIRAPTLQSEEYRGSGGQGRVKYGRGRPKGSYDYFIPGKGRVSVFEYRNYIRNQKQLYKMQLEQQRAMLKVQQRFQNKYAPETQFSPEQLAVQQQMQQQVMQQAQRPQFAGQSVPQVQPNPFKEISIIERTPLNLGGINLMGNGQTFQPINETFEETNLMTGNKTIRRRDGGLF
jgi:hypothetical protein